MAWPESVPDFGRFNLIYGWNCSGKTTLTSLFRDMQDRSPVSEGEVRIEIDGRTVRGSEFDTAVIPQVRVFDATTARRILFEDVRSQLPPVYYLGEESVEKRKRIEELKVTQEHTQRQVAACSDELHRAETDLESFCSDRAREIKNLLTVSGGGPYNNYDAPKFKLMASQVVPAEGEPARLDAATRQRHLSTKEGVTRAKISKSSQSFPDLATITRGASRALARAVVSTPLPELATDHALEAWVGQGLELHASEEDRKRCKFCGAPIALSRLQALEAHFSREFATLQLDISALLSSIQTARQRISSLAPPARELLYPHLLAEYGQAEQSWAVAAAAAGNYLDALERALRAKKAAPLGTMSLEQVVEQHHSASASLLLQEYLHIPEGRGPDAPALDAGAMAWAAVQSLLDKHNQHTDDFKKELGVARTALEKDEVAAAADGLRRRQAATSAAKAALAKAEERAGSLDSEVTQLELQIKEHRRPAEELNRDLASYLGHGELALFTEESGYTIQRNGRPAANLSESERTAFAFMHFLKSTRDTSFDRKNGVVVIDDPISSLDANSLFSAFGFMKGHVGDVGQLFIMTHNFSFFREVRQWFRRMPGQRKTDERLRPARFLMLECRQIGGTRCAVLERLDRLLEEYETEYHYLFDRLHQTAFAEAQEPLAACYGAPNMARRLLESFLAFRFPASAGNLSRQFEQLPVGAASKDRVLRFLNQYSHYQIAEPEHDLSTLSETQAVLRELFAIIKEVDPAHYAGMIELIRGTAGPTPD